MFLYIVGFLLILILGFVIAWFSGPDAKIWMIKNNPFLDEKKKFFMVFKIKTDEEMKKYIKEYNEKLPSKCKEVEDQLTLKLNGSLNAEEWYDYGENNNLSEPEFFKDWGYLIGCNPYYRLDERSTTKNKDMYKILNRVKQNCEGFIIGYKDRLIRPTFNGANNVSSDDRDRVNGEAKIGFEQACADWNI